MFLKPLAQARNRASSHGPAGHSESWLNKSNILEDSSFISLSRFNNLSVDNRQDQRFETSTSAARPRYKKLIEKIMDLERPSPEAGAELAGASLPSLDHRSPARPKKDLKSVYLMKRYDKTVLKDREEYEFKIDDKSVIRGVIDCHLKKLPLKLSIASTYSSWEFYLAFDRYPTFDNHVLKSMSSSVIIGTRFENRLTSDWSIRFILYSHKSCKVHLKADFHLTIPPEVDLTKNRLERLKDLKPYFNIHLEEGRVVLRDRMARKDQAKLKRRLREPRNGDDALDEADEIAQSVSGSHENSSRISGLNSIGLFYAKRRGYIERVRQLSRETNQRIEEARAKKETRFEDQQQLRVEYLKRREVKHERDTKMIQVLLVKFIDAVRAQALLRVIRFYQTLGQVERAIYRRKCRKKLFRLFWFLYFYVKVVRFKRRFQLAADITSSAISTYVLKLNLAMTSRISRKRLLDTIGAVLRAMAVPMKLRNMICSTVSILNKIDNRVRRHKATVDSFKEQFVSLMEDKFDLLHGDIDQDLSVNMLRKLFEDVKDEFFYLLFNTKLNEYLKPKIEKILKESILRKKIKNNKGLRYDKDGVEYLSKVKNFPNTEKRMRNSPAYNLYEEVMKHMKTPLLYRNWTAEKNPVKLFGTQFQAFKTIENHFSKNPVSSVIPKFSESGGAKRQDKILWRKMKNLLKLQQFKLDLNDQLASCFLWTIWKLHKNSVGNTSVKNPRNFN